MGGILYDDGPAGFWIFLVLTIVLGGSAAWATGRAIAQTWRPRFHIPMYMIPLAAAVRFLHFALFQETFVSLQYYLVTFVLLAVAAGYGFLSRRALQMSTQYSWLYEQSAAMRWRPKSNP